MYLNAPVQMMYPGIGIRVDEGSSEITLPVSERFFHAGKAVHGSIYFRLLDDAAYFAVNSTITDVFMLTSSFHIELLRPVTKGLLTANGRVLSANDKIIFAESELTDNRGKKIAFGKGSFMKSNTLLKDVTGYESI